MEANGTGGQDSRRAVAPSDDDETPFSHNKPNYSVPDRCH